MAQIVNNQLTNYSLYYNVLDYFKTIMSNHPSINRVTQGEISDFDTDEFPTYPIGNVMVVQSTLGEKTITHQIELVVADKQKNKRNESSGSLNSQTIPFYGTDDSVDIMANTLAIINDLTTFTQFSVEAFDIEGDIQCIPFKEDFDNGLAGHIARFNLVSFAQRDRCTFPLLIEDELDPSC